MSLLTRSILFVSKIGIMLCSFIVIIVIIFIYNCSLELPDYRQLAEYELPAVSRVYSNDDRVIAEYFNEYRMVVPIKVIPKRLINAFIAVEDKNFYSNSGVAISGIIRALFINLINIKNNQPLVGGSTITQQVVKNLLLTSEKSIKRKIKEAILAFKVSKVFSKDHIMELYLNKIYFGHGTYGIASAALKYFNKSINELNLEEEALLAALPQAPSRLDPFNNIKATKDRRNWVLNRMYEEGIITHAECLQAQSLPIVLSNKYSMHNQFRSEFFSDEVKRNVIKILGERPLFNGGYFIKTTLIPQYQMLAEQALINGIRDYDIKYAGWRGSLGNVSIIQDSTNNWLEYLKGFPTPKGLKEWEIAIVLSLNNDNISIGLTTGKISFIPNSETEWIYKIPDVEDLEDDTEVENTDGNIDNKNSITVGDIIVVSKVKGKDYYSLKQIPQVNGGIVMMDANTGKVLAMVGGYDYKISQFNVAVQALRQPGSVFKPFVYLAALENNVTPSTIINDEEVEIYQGPMLPSWKPRNYKNKFYGMVSARRGLELSQNTVTVQLARLIGIDKVMDVAKRFNIYKSDQNNYAMALGSNEVNLLSMTTAYAMLANGGKYIEPSLIEFITDRNGKVIYDNNIKCNKCMLDYIQDFTLNVPPQLSQVTKKVADASNVVQIVSLLKGATQRGTSQGVSSVGKNIAAKTGTSNNGVDNWFIGFWQNIVVGVYIGFDTPQTLGKSATGARIALPIFRDFMKKILRNTPDMPFKESKELNIVRVNKNNGLLSNDSTKDSDIIFERFTNNTEQIYYQFPFMDIVEYFDQLNQEVEREEGFIVY